METYTCNPTTHVDETGELLLIPSLKIKKKKEMCKKLKTGIQSLNFFFLITESGGSWVFHHSFNLPL